MHLVSDSTGETLKAVSNAAAAQFIQVEYDQTTYPMVRTKPQLQRVLLSIKKEKGVVLCTLVDQGLQEELEEFCKKEKVSYMPVMESIVNLLEYFSFSFSFSRSSKHTLVRNPSHFLTFPWFPCARSLAFLSPSPPNRTRSTPPPVFFTERGGRVILIKRQPFRCRRLQPRTRSSLLTRSN